MTIVNVSEEFLRAYYNLFRNNPDHEELVLRCGEKELVLSTDGDTEYWDLYTNGTRVDRFEFTEGEG